MPDTMHRRAIVRGAVTLAALAATARIRTAGAQAPPPSQPPQPFFRPGAVVQLNNTPHLWVADEHSLLHWAGDTRALAGRLVNWADRHEAFLVDLWVYGRREPWLSAGLLKIGDPIYLVKWETWETQPRLFHIQSIADVELFGINAQNYGQFVVDRATWERRFGFEVATLERLELPAAAPPPSPGPPPL